MVNWFKFVIVWCVALALPIQGIASATMVHCGKSHQRVHIVQAASAGMASAGHHHRAEVPEHPHPAGIDLVGSTATAEADEAQPDNLTGLAKTRCSACAVCCSVCALAGPLPSVPAAEAAGTVFADTVPAVAPFATEGPERPPRFAPA